MIADPAIRIFHDRFPLGIDSHFEDMTNEEMGIELWDLSPDFFIYCADCRDNEILLDFFGCLDADL